MSNARFGLRVRNGLVRGITEGLTAADPDVSAFVLAAGITNANQISAIQQLVLDLKTFGLWAKMKAVYPFVGGTAASHKFNLKNPLDTNAAFRLIFNGGWSHTSTGATPNGINAFADTFLIPSSILSLNSSHLSYYSRTNTAVNSAEIGSSNLIGSPPYLLLQLRTASNLLVSHINDDGGSVTITNTDGRGFYTGNRTASNVKTTFKNGIKIINDTYNSMSLNTSKIYIGAYNDGSSSSAFSNKETAFASIGDGLTDTEAANFYTAVQNFQITLGRQV